MFSVFNDVLAALKYYDAGKYRGLSVDFGLKGVYFDPDRGSNWWEYYCEPIELGSNGEGFEVFGDPPFARRREAEWHTTRLEAHTLIEKYIRFKPHVLEQVERYRKEHFEGRFVIGVHYRGTDKMKEEASVVYYPEVLDAVRGKIRELRRRDIAIYLATDEEALVALFTSFFPRSVTYQKMAKRSSRRGLPPHLDFSYDRYKAGEEAIVDCLLLSKCDLLIRTSSNLSLWSTFLNPEMTVIELNQRIDDEKPL